MPTTSARRRTGERVAAAVTAAAVLVLPACADDPRQPTTGTDAADVRGSGDLEDPYDGPYTADFHSDVEAYVDQEVTLEAAVERVLSPMAFTISGPGGRDVEPILVVSRVELPDLQPGEEVVVAARPRGEFEVPAVETALGVDLPEGTYDDWEGEPYLDAGIVRTMAG